MTTLSATKILFGLLRQSPVGAVGCFAVRAPQGTGGGHIILRQAGGSPSFSLDGLATQEARILVSAIAPTVAEAETIFAGIARTLDNAEIEIDGAPVAIARGSDTIADWLEGQAMFRRAALFEVTTYSAPAIGHNSGQGGRYFAPRYFAASYFGGLRI